MWAAIIQTIVAGVVGFVGGVAALWAQQRFAWRPQKRTELRNKVFDHAITALAMYETDALDAALQANSAQYSGLGLAPHVVTRPETRVALEKARLQVQAFFPAATFAAFEKALKTNVSLNNIPNTAYYQNADNAIKVMAKDLGLL